MTLYVVALSATPLPGKLDDERDWHTLASAKQKIKIINKTRHVARPNFFWGASAKLVGNSFCQSLQLHDFETNDFCFAHAVCRSFIIVFCHSENF